MTGSAMSSDSVKSDITIVGTGAAGLIAAVVLAKRGWSVTLVGKPAAADDWRTVALMHDSVDFLEKEGLWDPAADSATPLKDMRLIDAGGRVFHAPTVTFRSAEIGLPAFGQNIPLREFTARLAEEISAADSVIMISGEAMGFRQTDDEVAVSLADGTSVVSGLLADASGKRSDLRELAGLEVKRFDYPQAALVTVLDHMVDHQFISTEFHTRTGPMTFVPMQGNRCGLVLMETPEEAERLASLHPEQLALEVEHRSQSFLGRLSISAPVQVFPLSGHYAPDLVSGRYAAIGETAHAFPPIGAQGLNLTVRDISALTKCLGTKQNAKTVTPDRLSRFQRKRSADVMLRTRGVDALNRSLLTDFLPAQFGRSAVLTAARWIPPFRQVLMQEGVAPGRSLRSLFTPVRQDRERAGKPPR